MKALSRVPPALIVFALALIVYGLSAQVWAHPTSLAPHYVYLAQSLLHGHVDLIQLPPVTYDLLQFNGQWYVAGSPMPSILMLPFVAIFGVNFSDVLFSIVLGAINVALVYSLLTDLTQTWQLPQSSIQWLTLLFAVGTPHWYLASLGTYWFTAHIVTVFFALLAVREALTKQRWFLSGLWLACAGFARPTALFLAPFFVIMIYYAVRMRSAEYESRTTHYVRLKLLPFGLAIALGISAHVIYNYARFKSFSDFGYAYVAGAENITSVYARYGGFNARFLPCNLAVSLFGPPEVNGVVPDFITRSCDYLLEGVNLSDTSALITPNPLGMSIFITTPVLLSIFAARKRDPIIIATWLGLLSTLIPLWHYHNTGSLQFGWRYLFDAAPMWIILLAAGMQKVTRLKQGLILVSMAINLWGMLWMFEKLVGK